MKKILLVLLIVMFICPLVFAKDVYVNGYYRKDGTYVRSHVRSSPDEYKWNNYGPSQSDDELMNPRSRDYDNDGVPNYMDKDDDNDGTSDDNEE